MTLLFWSAVYLYGALLVGKQRPQDEFDQSMPIPHPEQGDIQSLVIEDIAQRREVGIARYGTPLQPHNGRDALLDAYHEALDLVMYLKQALIERDT